jgi:hypothetical protein
VLKSGIVFACSVRGDVGSAVVHGCKATDSASQVIARFLEMVGKIAIL